MFLLRLLLFYVTVRALLERVYVLLFYAILYLNESFALLLTVAKFCS